MINHPHHLTLSEVSSAFIPFCAYGSNLTALGVAHPNLTMNMCNSFKPTLLNAELCYTLDLNLKARGGMDGGLVLLLDYNTERSILTEDFIQNKEDSNLLKYKTEDTITSARIYIPTLAPFSGYGSGSYVMTSLKQMTGTKNFLNLPSKDKKCENYKFEDCMSTQLLNKGSIEVGCLPFGWTSLFTDKVCLADPAKPGAALQTPSSLIQSVSQSVSHPFPKFVYTTKLMRLTQFLKRCVSASVVELYREGSARSLQSRRVLI